MDFDNDLYQDFKLTKRRPLNLIHNLLSRELGTYSSTLYLTSSICTDYSNKNELIISNQLKRIYLSIFPSYSILNVKSPNCFFRRFSPDGRYLIAFNQHLTGIQIFTFKGSSAGVQQLHHINTNIYRNQSNSNQKSSIPTFLNDKTDFNDFESDQFRFRAFDTYFKEKSNLRLTENNELMHREFALFYNNSYLIVASSTHISDDNLPPYDQLATNNEAIHYSSLENYTIYLIDLNNAKLCDKLKFNADKMNLTNNQSFGLFKNVFVILSQQNQTIHVYNILPKSDHNSSLKFVLIKQIGRFCDSDDIDYVNFIPSGAGASNEKAKTRLQSRLSNNRRVSRLTQQTQFKPFSETCFTSMKHRILSFFYREALETNTLSQFYVNLNSYINLKMYKMQLLDDRHLLIKYVNLEHMMSQRTTVTRSNVQSALSSSSMSGAHQQSPFIIINNVTNNVATTTTASLSTNEPPTFPSSINSAGLTSTTSSTLSMSLNENLLPFYFVLYDMKETKILNILRNTSQQLLNVYENFQDYFSLSSLDGYSVDESYNNSRVYGSNLNYHSLPSNNQYANQLLQRYIKNISKISTTETTKYLLSHLPISSQSYTITPYLDHSLFSYDEKFISNLERPKPIGDQIIKFYARDSGRLLFRLYPGLSSNQNNNNTSSSNHHSNYKRLVAFIWHPREPFCISVQRTFQEYNVNFHVFSKNNLI